MMTMNGPGVALWIDRLVMAALGLFCLRYAALDGRSFAETSVFFSFLDFPVFVGEFLLLGCVLLCVLRVICLPVKLTKWSWLFVLFMCFVFLKALAGYLHRGPLALRDAAMFYYSIFSVVVYVCYRSDLFRPWIILVCYAALLLVSFYPGLNEFWTISRILICLALVCMVPNRTLVLWMLAGIAITVTPTYFLQASRALIMASFISLSFLVLAIALMVDGTKRREIFAVSIFAVFAFAMYLFCFSGIKHAQGIFAFDRVRLAYEEAQSSIDEKKATFKPYEIEKTMVYNPDNKAAYSEEEMSQDALNQVSPELDQRDEKALREADLLKKMKIGTTVFRIFVWRDAVRELLKERPLIGFDFGKPFRSESLEMVRWGLDDWKRDGWIAMHNSYLNIVYRAGLIGVVFIVVLCSFFLRWAAFFIRIKSKVGILLCASLLAPLIAANFSVTLELPYTAIPIWVLWGLTAAYAREQQRIVERPLGQAASKGVLCAS